MSTAREVKLEPGWLIRDVRKATDRLREWAMTTIPVLCADDLRYLSMLAWRQGTRRAEDIADRIDKMLAAQQWRQQPQRQATSYEEYLAGYHGAIPPKTREQFEATSNGVDDESWIPPYARVRSRSPSRPHYLIWCSCRTPADCYGGSASLGQCVEQERAQQSQAHKHFDVV